MALSVIGSGFGRTGTRSLKEALETLGFGPCHHMEEVFQHPDEVPHWQALARGESVDWEAVFANYGAQIDWPGAHIWRELSVLYPDAKVIHSVRPEDMWWGSFSRTIGKMAQIYKTLPLPPHASDMLIAWEGFVGHPEFGGDYVNRDRIVAAYHRREADVRAAIAPERLLVFDVAQGWEPLCQFLGVPVPATPFPHRNVTEDFWAHFGGEPA